MLEEGCIGPRPEVAAAAHLAREPGRPEPRWHVHLPAGLQPAVGAQVFQVPEVEVTQLLLDLFLAVGSRRGRRLVQPPSGTARPAPPAAPAQQPRRTLKTTRP